MNVWRLSFRYLLFHRWRSLVLIVSLSLVFFLPVGVHWLVREYHQHLLARAGETPLLVGAKGSRFDLLFNNAYFSLESPTTIPFGELDKAESDDLAIAIPLHVRFTAKKFPIIGTTLDYFDFRKLTLATGTFPQILGDAVIGSRVAAALNLRVRDKLISDPANLFDISRVYPLRMPVVGILRERSSPDDDGVFVDLRTAWIIDGIGHGHQDAPQTGNQLPGTILSRSEATSTHLTFNDSIVQFNEITPENLRSFHFHGNDAEFPLTGLIVIPKDQKGSTIIQGRYSASVDRQMIEPLSVIEDLMRTIFKVEKLFDLFFILVAVSSLLFLGLATFLSIRTREREMEILFMIGCGKGTVAWICASEIVLILACSGILAVVLSAMLVHWAPGLSLILL